MRSADIGCIPILYGLQDNFQHKPEPVISDSCLLILTKNVDREASKVIGHMLIWVRRHQQFVSTSSALIERTVLFLFGEVPLFSCNTLCSIQYNIYISLKFISVSREWFWNDIHHGWMGGMGLNTTFNIKGHTVAGSFSGAGMISDMPEEMSNQWWLTFWLLHLGLNSQTCDS